MKETLLLPLAQIIFLLVIGMLSGAFLQKATSGPRAVFSKTVWTIAMLGSLIDSSLVLTMLFISIVHILKKTSI